MAADEGWYPDPTGRFVFRWWDGEAWTSRAMGDDASATFTDPFTATSAASRAEPEADPEGAFRASRLWLWVVVAVGSLLLVVVAAAVVYDVFFERPYAVDLRSGGDVFPERDAGSFATRSDSDGFHVVVREANTWAPTGVRGPALDKLSVEITTVGVQSPADGSVGPFCGADRTHGYAFVVSPSGLQQLVRFDGAVPPPRVLAQEQKTPWVPGRAYRLSLACIVPDMSNYPLLDGEVNSRGTLSDVDDSSRRFSRFPFTGFVAHTAAGAPAEWKITRFVRN